MQNITPDKLPPNNVEAEEALLGAALVDYDTVARVSKVGIAAGDFYIVRYGWLWQVLKDIKTSNLVNVSDELNRRGRLAEFGGSGCLSELVNRCPSTSDAENYAKVVKRDSIKRQAISAAGDIARLAFRDGTSATEVLGEANRLITQISKDNLPGQSKTMLELANEAMDDLELLRQNPNAIYGIPTGLTDLDKTLGGLQKGDLIIFAGVPGSGKTSLALQIAMDSARFHGKRNLFASAEMPAKQLFLRQQAYLSGIDSQRIKTGKIEPNEWAGLLAAINTLSTLPIIIDDKINTTEAIRARAIIEQDKGGLDLVVVDYIQRLHRNGGSLAHNRAQEVGEIGRELKDLAKELDIPVIALSSLSRQYAGREGKRPIMSDLKESGDLEHEADIIMFTHRPELFDPETEFPNIAEFIIAKHRNGATGSISVYFRKRLTQFVDVELRTQKLEQIGEHYATNM